MTTKLRPWLALVLLPAACLAFGQAGSVAQLSASDRQGILSALRAFESRFQLLRPVTLDEGAISEFMRLPPNLAVGPLNDESGSHAALQLDKGTPRVTVFMLQPYLRELPPEPKSGRAFGTVEDAWNWAESHLKDEVALGPGLERDWASWLAVEGTPKAAIRLAFKPKAQDYPVGRNSEILTLAFRALDGALIEYSYLPIEKLTGSRILVSKEKALMAAKKALVSHSGDCEIRLAYLLPPYARTAGLIYSRSGQPYVPSPQLMWEAVSGRFIAAVNPETGVVDWTGELAEPQSTLPVNPSSGPVRQGGLSRAFSSAKKGGLSLLVQGAGLVVIFGVVTVVINSLMSQGRKSKT